VRKYAQIWWFKELNNDGNATKKRRDTS